MHRQILFIVDIDNFHLLSFYLDHLNLKFINSTDLFKEQAFIFCILKKICFYFIYCYSNLYYFLPSSYFGSNMLFFFI